MSALGFKQIQQWAREAGASDIAIADLDLVSATDRLQAWLQAGFHGEMHWFHEHLTLRADPTRLLPGAQAALVVRFDYLPDTHDWQRLAWDELSTPHQGVISIYARGRDYHKVVRKRLAQLGQRIDRELTSHGYRACVDSAPVMEVELAVKAGLGWRGKHTLLLNRHAGSMFFLGVLLTDLPLAPTPFVSAHCGACTKCIDICPTRAIVAPYSVDARRCISYLTIEHPGSIPEPLRPLMGNRIYGCDDCQLICPWNRWAQASPLPDFQVRSPLHQASLVALASWSEADFIRHTEGSPIRRIGYTRWRRNIAVAMGNALGGTLLGSDRSSITTILGVWGQSTDGLVKEHAQWALTRGV